MFEVYRPIDTISDFFFSHIILALPVWLHGSGRNVFRLPVYSVPLEGDLNTLMEIELRPLHAFRPELVHVGRYLMGTLCSSYYREYNISGTL